jgi:glucans biosynthesis protein
MLRPLTTALALLAALLLQPLPARAFGFDDVAELARQQAAQPYRPVAAALPKELLSLDYDALRDIRFRPERSRWRGLPFEVQFFHVAGRQADTVALHELVDGQPRPWGYEAADWDYGRNRLDPARWAVQPGLAGFRVHYPLNNPAYKDELVVFLGASYFRALGRGQQYGLSARALAIDTVGAPAGRGEEFPRFTAFWLQRPAPGDKALTLLALLDSPRASAALHIVVTPGDDSTVELRQRLFLRAPVAQLGLAPLTSMYLHGENQPAPADFRPEVHDSDGLLVAADGEWLWRPLVRPNAPLASSFAAQRLQGFGLLQRDRRFAAYEDGEAHYERRPSAWVEPLGDWGPGRVQLLQLPTPDETHDNIVAAWVPERVPAPGQALDIAWRVHWQGERVVQPPQGWTVQSRRGRGWAAPAPGEVQFNIDFDGPALRALPPGAAVQAVASAGTGVRVTEARAFPHPQGGWRVLLRVKRERPDQPAELRLFLRHGADTLTETWAALLPADLPAEATP